MVRNRVWVYSCPRGGRGNENASWKKRQSRRRHTLSSSRAPAGVCRNWHHGTPCRAWLPRLHRAGPSASLDKNMALLDSVRRHYTALCSETQTEVGLLSAARLSWSGVPLELGQEPQGLILAGPACLRRGHETLADLGARWVAVQLAAVVRGELRAAHARRFAPRHAGYRRRDRRRDAACTTADAAFHRPACTRPAGSLSHSTGSVVAAKKVLLW
jgi:hypothetical protein